eukprot:SAG11_NODE_5313_length_1599_cov_4.156667_1_plen_100_part_00
MVVDERVACALERFDVVLGVAYELEPFVFDVVSSVVRGRLVREDEFVTDVVAETDDIIESFVVLVHVPRGGVILVDGHRLEFVLLTARAEERLGGGEDI